MATGLAAGGSGEDARRLTTIPGFGAIVASALVAAVGGRDLAEWLGLVPRQFTTGGKPKLLGISKVWQQIPAKATDPWARAALPYVAERDTPLGRWAKELSSRAHRNVVVVAFASKLARIALAVLRRGQRFAAMGVCERVRRDGLTVERRSGSLVQKRRSTPAVL